MEGDSQKGDDIESKVTSNGIIAIKIKTLDSKVYTCQVTRNVSVPDLKDQLATLTGVPSESQRLICRGKVLKEEHNLSTYEVEEGHTLHLVTRQAPTSLPATSSAGRPENEDPHAFGFRERPGHGSHSILLGAFNPSEHLGSFPEINRIFSTVLSSLRMNNIFPLVLGAGNDNGRTAESAPEQQGAVGRQQLQTDDRDHTGSMDAMQTNDLIVGWQPGPGILSTSPGAGPQIDVVQQTSHTQEIPDSLRSVSHHVRRMEQLLAAVGHQVQQQEVPPAAGDPLTSWPSVIYRIRDLLRNQAAFELEHLADQLGSEMHVQLPSHQGLALSIGYVMQHLGGLLQELGHTLATRAYTVELAPQHAFSGHPHSVPQPGGALDDLPGIATQSSIPSLRSFAQTNMLENINIHIHASSMGSSPSLQGDDLLGNLSDQNRGLQNDHIEIASQAGHEVPTTTSTSDQGPPFREHGTIRIVPARTFVAAIPTVPRAQFPMETAGPGMGIFYPLLASFQQLIPRQLEAASVANLDDGGRSVHPHLQSEPSSTPSEPEAQLYQRACSEHGMNSDQEPCPVSPGPTAQHMTMDTYGFEMNSTNLHNNESAMVRPSRSPSLEDFLGSSPARDNVQAGTRSVQELQVSTRLESVDDETQLQLNCRHGNTAPCNVGNDGPITEVCRDYGTRDDEQASISETRRVVLQDFLSLAYQTTEMASRGMVDADKCHQQDFSLVLENTVGVASCSASVDEVDRSSEKHPLDSDLESVPGTKRQKIE